MYFRRAFSCPGFFRSGTRTSCVKSPANLISSRVCESTKLLKQSEVAYRMAPAWAATPTGLTIQITSTEPNSLVNWKRQETYKYILGNGSVVFFSFFVVFLGNLSSRYFIDLNYGPYWTNLNNNQGSTVSTTNRYFGLGSVDWYTLGHTPSYILGHTPKSTLGHTPRYTLGHTPGSFT